MTTRFRKIDGQWGVLLGGDTQGTLLGYKGKTVEVTTKAGDTKSVKLDKPIAMLRQGVVYSVDRSEQEAGPASAKQVQFLARLLMGFPERQVNLGAITRGEATKLIDELVRLKKSGRMAVAA